MPFPAEVDKLLNAPPMYQLKHIPVPASHFPLENDQILSKQIFQSPMHFLDDL
jgi:hypothetical protein